MHTAFPDLRYDIEDIITEGDKAATFVTFSGTHTGPLRDLAQIGRQVSVEQDALVSADPGRGGGDLVGEG